MMDETVPRVTAPLGTTPLVTGQLVTGQLVTALLLTAMVVTAQPAMAQVHRCERAGKITFSDQPCEAEAKASQKAYATASASGSLDLKVVVTHYDVTGRTFDALTRSLRANGPQGFHGMASWRIGYQYRTIRQADTCRIDTVITTVSGEILMPRWIDEATAAPALQRRWTEHYAALKRHEDGHIQHGRELALLVKERLMGLGSVACDTLKGLADGEFQRLHQNLKTRDRQYDARTGHGATQGAFFEFP